MAKKFYGSPSVLKRIISLLLDLVIINLVIIRPFRGLIVENIGKSTDFSETLSMLNSNPEITSMMTSILFISSLLAIIYFSVLEWKFGQSIGQMIMNLYVQPEKNKKDMKYLQCLVNNMFVLPFFPVVLLWVIDPIYLFYTGGNQRLSERISGTKIMQEYVVPNEK